MSIAFVINIMKSLQNRFCCLRGDDRKKIQTQKYRIDVEDR